MASIAQQTVVDAEPMGDDGLESPEARRWLMLLGVPFIVGGALFATALGTDTMWLLLVAGLFGPGAIILGFTYLGLTSDTNRFE
jgi:hypothetical protein